MASISSDPRFRLARALVMGGGGADVGVEVGDGDVRTASSSSSSSSSPMDDAIDIFASLLEESETIAPADGVDGAVLVACPNVALCMFEYGNALFRAAVRGAAGRGEWEGNDQDDDDDNDDDRKPEARGKVEEASSFAAAGTKRSASLPPDEMASGSVTTSNKRHRTTTENALDDNDNKADDEDEDDDDDMDLALEMMDGSWSMLLSLIGDDDCNDRGGVTRPSSWALDQLPRVLRCIGDLHSHRRMHGTAVDLYIRSMQYRERAWEEWEEEYSRRNGDGTIGPRKDDEDGINYVDGIASMYSTTSSFDALLDGLRRKRHLVEAYALVAEELLASPEGEDVVARRPDDDVGDDDIDDDGRGSERDPSATEASTGGASGNEKMTAIILARADERLDYARGHYEMARTGLEDVLCRYATLTTMANGSAAVDLGTEKEDIGILVLTVVGVGMTIEEQDR